MDEFLADFFSSAGRFLYYKYQEQRGRWQFVKFSDQTICQSIKKLSFKYSIWEYHMSNSIQMMYPILRVSKEIVSICEFESHHN